jgi:hypothetical protein
MLPIELPGDNIRGALDTAVSDGLDRRRLVKLLNQVAGGYYSDFFSPDDIRGYREIELPSCTECGQQSTVKQQPIHNSIPQWKAPRRHCRLGSLT